MPPEVDEQGMITCYSCKSPNINVTWQTELTVCIRDGEVQMTEVDGVDGALALRITCSNCHKEECLTHDHLEDLLLELASKAHIDHANLLRPLNLAA